MMEKELVGTVIHYYPRVSVAVVELSAPLAVGERIAVEDKQGKQVLSQAVESMQMDHRQVQTASAGQSIGLGVGERVHNGNKVYKTS